MSTRSQKAAARKAARRVLALGSLGGAVLLWCMAGIASADTASLSVTTATGANDPAAGLPRVFTLSGTAAVSETYYVKYRAVGGAPCAPTAASDSGATLGHFYGETLVNGAFSIKYESTMATPGTYLFCIWLAANSNSVVTPIPQTLTFRAPTGTITATVDPVSPLIGTTAKITVAGASEAPRYAYAKVRLAGGSPCAATYSEDSGVPLLSGESVNGAFSLPTSTIPDKPGTYLLCLWLANSSTDSSPIAGPQSATYNALAPPPPPPKCVVPRILPGARLAAMKKRIVAAHCLVGKVRYVRSRKVRRGLVMRIIPSAHTKRPNNTLVALTVSAGPPPKHRR